MQRFIWFFILIFYHSIGLSVAAEPHVNYHAGKISAFPPQGLKVQGENIEVLSTIECGAKTESRNAIQVPKSCGYLHGLYRFIYLNKETSVKHQALVDFAMTQDGRGGQTFLVGDQLEIKE